MSDFTDRLVQACHDERGRFENGALKEWMEPVFRRVGDYWDRLADLPQYAGWQGYNGRSDVRLGANGRPVADGNRNQPWSAAFISFVMREAGAGDTFAYAPSHSVYVVKALREAAKAASKHPFIARRHKLYAPKPGDLIACERQKTVDPNFDTYVSFVAQGRFEAHSDIVTEVTDKAVTTVGGNVGNSVREKRWPLDTSGHIGNADPLSRTSMVICVIESRL